MKAHDDKYKKLQIPNMTSVRAPTLTKLIKKLQEGKNKRKCYKLPGANKRYIPFTKEKTRED